MKIKQITSPQLTQNLKLQAGGLYKNLDNANQCKIRLNLEKHSNKGLYGNQNKLLQHPIPRPLKN